MLPKDNKYGSVSEFARLLEPHVGNHKGELSLIKLPPQTMNIWHQLVNRWIGHLRSHTKNQYKMRWI